MTSSQLENTVDIGKRYDVGLDSALGRNVLLVWVDLQYNTGDGFILTFHQIGIVLLSIYNKESYSAIPSATLACSHLQSKIHHSSFTSGIEPIDPSSAFNPSFIPADSAYALYRVTQLLNILAARLLRVPRRR